jgi:hypothetical protein
MLDTWFQRASDEFHPIFDLLSSKDRWEFSSSRERAEMGTEIVRPQDYGEYPSPKTQVQEPDRKQPSRAPQSAR